MSKDDKAVAIFEEMGLQTTQRSRILEMDPDFVSRPEADQRDLIAAWLEGAQGTMDGVKSRFPQIKIKHAGSVVFEMPAADGGDDGDYVKEFAGVILDQYITKAYWKESMGSGSGSPPDCASLNGRTPYVDKPVSASCLDCPLNRFGSGRNDRGEPTKGKACKDVKRLVVHVEGNRLPCRMSVSAANIKALDAYLNLLFNRDIPMNTVITHFKAVKAENRNNVEYTGLELSIDRRLDAMETLTMRREVVQPFGDQFRLGAVENSEADGAAMAPNEAERAAAGGQKASAVM